MKKREPLTKIIRDRPELTVTELCDMTGASPGVVRSTRSAIKKGVRRIYNLNDIINERPRLQKWLLQTRPEGITMAEHVVSVLEDAMHEEENQGLSHNPPR